MNDENTNEEEVMDEEVADDADNELQEETLSETETPFILPTANRIAWTDAPAGLCRADDEGLQIIDTMSGQHSVFGFGDSSLIEAAMQASEDLALMSPQNQDELLWQEIQPLSSLFRVDRFSSACALAHADLAVEVAIAAARTRLGGDRFRTIALVGSDHGRTGVCRTASGMPSLREDYGPLMAGFAHVPAGDLNAVESCIDDQTGCLLISPAQWHHAGRPLDADFITGLRRLCDQHDLLLAVDESACVFGTCGTLLAIDSIVEVEIDLAILSAGLFGGMPGGLLLASSKVDLGQDLSRCPSPGQASQGNPIATAVAISTLHQLHDRDLLATASESSHQLAVELATAIAGFEFVRDVFPLGSSIGIETDIPSSLLVKNAAHFGVWVMEAGETGIRMSLPLVISQDNLAQWTRRLTETFEATEKMTAAVSV